MSWIPELTLLLALQGPQTADAGAASLDVIELQGGGRIEGVVVVETDDYIEIEIGSDTVVGFERSRIASLERGVANAPDARASLALAPRDDWFVLHDADGVVVGRLHCTVTTDDEGRIRIGEEWSFGDAGESTEITRLEVLTGELSPLSTFYRERRRRVFDGRAVVERVVRGEVSDGSLVVEKKTLRDHERRVYEWREGLHFPLGATEQLRQTSDGEMRVDVFDAQTEAFVSRVFEVVDRRVDWRGEVRRVRELRHRANGQPNWEWLDAQGKTLRREVNGQGLVAVPVGPELSQNYVNASEPVFPASYILETGERFALWMPTPSWRAEEEPELGRVTLHESVHGGSACLLVLDQLDSDVMLDTAADTVDRWLRVVKPGLRAAVQARAKVRERRAVRLSATYVEPRVGAPVPYRTDVYVFELGEVFVALCFDAPEEGYDALQADFDRMLATVDLHPVVEEAAASTVAGR